MKVAFYGRVSTDDAQDPSLSIPRQLRKCNEALAPIGERVGATYWEVDSGRKDLDDRGRGKRDWSAEVDVPCAGDMHKLLADAEAAAFDAVIVESIDRVSRMTFDGTRIERELEKQDIALLAADEPLNSSATAILTRRVKQGVAEWYVRGPAPYGYLLEPHPHPNPQKAREGRKKHRLVIDTVRGPIALLIFTWYVEEELGLGTICERLNSDLDRYPPPKRNRKDENDLPQTWSKSQLHSLLRNPKYTGYNVWGAMTNAVAARCCARAKNGSGALLQPTRRSFRASCSTRSRSAPSETLIPPAPPRRSTTRNAATVESVASTCCAVECAAAFADGEWRAAIRRAPTGIGAST